MAAGSADLMIHMWYLLQPEVIILYYKQKLHASHVKCMQIRVVYMLIIVCGGNLEPMSPACEDVMMTIPRQKRVELKVAVAGLKSGLGGGTTEWLAGR